MAIRTNRFAYHLVSCVSQPVAYTITNERLNLHLAVRDVSSLFLHEETILELLEQLASEIEADGCVKNPIIVDQDSMVVLDGMHRMAASKKLKIKRIPVCLIDYKSPHVSVCNWYKTITGASNMAQILNIVTQTGNTVREVKEIKEETLGVAPKVAAIKFRSQTFLVESRFQNMREAYNIIERIEKLLATKGLTINHATETNALQDLRIGQIDAVICTPPITKKEVVQSALSGQVFAHKTTRHVIPARPIGLNVPLELLRDEKKSLTDINRELSRMLQDRRLRRVPLNKLPDDGGSEEELYIFEE